MIAAVENLSDTYRRWFNIWYSVSLALSFLLATPTLGRPEVKCLSTTSDEVLKKEIRGWLWKDEQPLVHVKTFDTWNAIIFMHDWKEAKSNFFLMYMTDSVFVEKYNIQD